MFERLDQIEARYEELTNALASPDIVNDSAKYQKTAKAHRRNRAHRREISRVQRSDQWHRREQGHACSTKKIPTCAPMRRKNSINWKAASQPSKKS